MYEKIINDEIKKLEITRQLLIDGYSKMIDKDKMNYDLYGKKIIAEQQTCLRQINELGIKLQTLYDIKKKAQV
jgi:hypothetical protein